MSFPSYRAGHFRPSSPSMGPWQPVNPHVLTIHGRSHGLEGDAEQSAVVLNHEDVSESFESVQIQYACPQAVTLAELVIESRAGSPGIFAPSSSSYDSFSCSSSSPDSMSLDVRSPTPNGLVRLGEVLKRNSPIGVLNLRGNGISDEQILPIFNGLKDNRTVTALDLKANALTDGAMESLSQVLTSATTLQTLDLSTNQITHRGVEHLVNGLQTNTTLTSLGLASNEINDTGADVLARGLLRNETLTSLDVRYNPIGEQGIQSLRFLLDHCPTLTSIQFVSFEEARQVIALFSVNVEDFEAAPQTLVEASQRNQRNQQVRIPSLYDRLVEKMQIGMYDPFPHRKLNSKSIAHLAAFIQKHPYLNTLNLQEVQMLSEKGRVGAIDLLKAHPHIVSLSPYLDVRAGIRQALRRNRTHL